MKTYATENQITQEQLDLLDKRIEQLYDAGLGGLISGPWIDKCQEKYHNEMKEYFKGNREKPEIIFVS